MAGVAKRSGKDQARGHDAAGAAGDDAAFLSHRSRPIPTRPLLILLAVAVTSHAQAATERELIAAVRVPLADLNLAAEHDAGLALGRLRDAAYLACGGDAKRHRTYEEAPRHTVRVFRECREDALLRAVYGARAPALDRAHATRAPDDR